MNSAARLALCGALMLVTIAEVCAQQAASTPSPTPGAALGAGQVIVPSARSTVSVPATGSSSGVQLAIYLCLLVALLGGGTYLMKNGFGFLQPKNKGVRKLNVAETRMLGNRQFLVVAEYEGRKMLLGVCPGRIELISDLGGKTDEPFSSHLSPTP